MTADMVDDKRLDSSSEQTPMSSALPVPSEPPEWCGNLPHRHDCVVAARSSERIEVNSDEFGIVSPLGVNPSRNPKPRGSFQSPENFLESLQEFFPFLQHAFSQRFFEKIFM